MAPLQLLLLTGLCTAKEHLVDVRPMVDIEDFLDAMTVEDMDIMVDMVNKVKMRDKVDILEKSEEVDLVTIFTGGGGKMEGQLARMVSSLLEHSSDTTIRLTVVSDTSSWPTVQRVVAALVVDHQGHNNTNVLLEYAGAGLSGL